ncbi:MAG: ABC transporter permease [Deltaproteobacteria bacterium]
MEDGSVNGPEEKRPSAGTRLKGIFTPLPATLLPWIIVLSAWEILVRVLHVSPSLLPGPLAVLKGLAEIFASGVLIDHIVASLFRVSWGYALAIATAIPLGLLLGLVPTMHRLANPIVQFLRPISPLAWIPLALLWFGIGDRSAIFIIYLSVVLPLTVFTTSGIFRIRPIYRMVAQNYGIRGWELARTVILPGAFPEIVVGLRITLGTAWLVIVAAEMIAVRSGLGYLILDARNSLRMDLVVGGMLVIGGIGLLLDTLVSLLRRLPEARWPRMER